MCRLLWESRNLTNVNKTLQQQNNPDAKGADAAFHWLYRPELSFSVVDLEVNSILQHSNDPEDAPVELIDKSEPVISSEDSAIEIFYKLLGSKFDRITPLDGEQTFILAFGEEEIEITMQKVGSGTGVEETIKFSNLEHLAQIKPEDYLSIRLYLNEDSQNTLWDWAFNTLDLDIDSDNNNGLEKPDRTLKEEELETEQNQQSKQIHVNNGDINHNEIPDFAEFQYLTDEGQKSYKEFVPFVVEIPSHVDLKTATIKFEYAGSDPSAIKKVNIGDDEDPEYQYTAAPGTYRLWRKNGDEFRSPESMINNGDYITPNEEIGPIQLGFEASKLSKTFYMEGIRGTAMNGATVRVYLEYQP